MDVYKVLRWLGAAILGYVLVISVLLLPTAAVFRFVTAKPDQVKAIVEKSGAYDKAPEVLYDRIKQENQDKTDVSLDNPSVKQAALETFNPQFFKTNVDAFVDGSYAWLDGKTAQPEFDIDISEQKTQFIDKVVAAEQTRTESLPRCNLQQLRQMDPATVNIFNLQCIPPSVNIGQEAQKAKDELSNNQEFIDKTRLESSDVKTDSGEPLFSQNTTLPNMFQLFKNMFWILVALATSAVVGLYFISVNKPQVLRKIAKIFISGGIVALLAPFFIKFFTQKLFSAATNEQVVSDLLSPVVQEFNAATAAMYYRVGGGLLLLGILVFIVVHKKLIPFGEQEKKI